MKHVLLTLLIGSYISTAFAETNYLPDTVITKSDTIKTKHKTVSITIKTTDNEVKSGKADSINKVSKSPGFNLSLTFSRFDLGFAKLIDNGSFTLGANNQFLNYQSGKTSNVGFDIVQAGYRFNSYFKIYVSGGFDWTLIRLKNDFTITPNAPVLSYTETGIDYNKNRFSSSYFRIPLSFEYRSKDDKIGKKFHFIAGPEGGFLLNGKVKQISDDKGKKKIKDDYHFNTFRYGAFARLGYGGGGIFAKYYFNDMFENSPKEKGLKTMSFGLMFGF